MKAQEVMEHFRSVGQWVDWENTRDKLLHGDLECHVKGVATAWIPTNRAIEQAAEKGLNLFVSHEGAFFDNYRGTPSADELIRCKKELLDSHGITVIRCHDTWDRMPGVGICDAWGDWLGFETEERPVESFHKICLLGDMTVEQAARRVAERVAELGQDTVLVFGDRRKRVSRMAIGTGAGTHLPTMYELSPDIILATDDGVYTTSGGLWAADLGMPLLIVNHATSEKPGMMAMAAYLRDVFPGLPVEYLDVEFPYQAL
ncbi:MAG: Nif3-like dinuclear metal center hexameric protein [Candidatus Brocadiae bacterium]|nr:Nif3-like dinuclear metal center hexameric protein [Candidatus Brocadiia bacterium]